MVLEVLAAEALDITKLLLVVLQVVEDPVVVLTLDQAVQVEPEELVDLLDPLETPVTKDQLELAETEVEDLQALAVQPVDSLVLQLLTPLITHSLIPAQWPDEHNVYLHSH